MGFSKMIARCSTLRISGFERATELVFWRFGWWVLRARCFCSCVVLRNGPPNSQLTSIHMGCAMDLSLEMSWELGRLRHMHLLAFWEDVFGKAVIGDSGQLTGFALLLLCLGLGFGAWLDRRDWVGVREFLLLVLGHVQPPLGAWSRNRTGLGWAGLELSR